MEMVEELKRLLAELETALWRGEKAKAEKLEAEIRVVGGPLAPFLLELTKET